MNDLSFKPIDFSSELPSDLFNGFFINGTWYRASSSTCKNVVSPATQEVLFSVPFATAREVDAAVASAKDAFEHGPWPRMTPPERAEIMLGLADALTARLPVLAHLWTAQVGAPISLARQLLGLAVDRLRYFASLAATFEFETMRQTRHGHARILSEPVGVAALIIPWNATIPILMTKLGAALAAGCTCVVKSSPESPLDAMVLALCAVEAKLPPGVLNIVLADAAESAHLVASRDVTKVSFTGSVATGSAIAAVVASRMGRLTMEMGGKSAALLLPDADIAKAMPTLSRFAMPFSGQFCFAQSRLVIPRARADEITEAYAAEISAFRVGDPWDERTQVGPVLNRRQFDKVTDYIQQGVRDGAEIVTGGQASTMFRGGYYITPTLLRKVSRNMSIAREEIFGPVATIHTYDTIDEAIEIVNDTAFGLTGSVFGDVEQAYHVARRLQLGQIGINGMEMSPAAPFGGFKMSGVGREGGTEGLQAFLETKALLMPSQ